MRGQRLLPVVIAGACLVSACGAQAAGFYIQEVGTPRSLGTAGVANSTSTGADAAWSNPAGMAFVDQDQVLAGLQLVVPNVRFDSSVATAGGSDGDTAGIFTAAPSFFYVNRVSDRWSLGLSVAGIMGGGVDYGDDFTGRYSTSRAQLSAVGLSPSIAYKIDDRF